MNEVEYFMFPVRNEQGFRVVNQDNYVHMMRCIMEATIELMEEYPDKHILVVYKADSGMDYEA